MPLTAFAVTFISRVLMETPSSMPPSSSSNRSELKTLFMLYLTVIPPLPLVMLSIALTGTELFIAEISMPFSTSSKDIAILYLPCAPISM